MIEAPSIPLKAWPGDVPGERYRFCFLTVADGVPAIGFCRDVLEIPLPAVVCDVEIGAGLVEVIYNLPEGSYQTWTTEAYPLFEIVHNSKALPPYRRLRAIHLIAFMESDFECAAEDL